MLGQNSNPTRHLPLKRDWGLVTWNRLTTGNAYGERSRNSYGERSPTGNSYGELRHPRGVVTGIRLIHGELLRGFSLTHGELLRGFGPSTGNCYGDLSRRLGVCFCLVPRGLPTGKIVIHGGLLRKKPVSTGDFYGETRHPRGISTGKPVFHGGLLRGNPFSTGDFYGGFLRGNPFSTGDFYGETPFSTGDFCGENRFLQRISTDACKATGKNDSKATSAKEGALWCKRGGGVVGWMPTGLCTGVRCCALAFAFDSLMMLGIAWVMSLLVFCRNRYLRWCSASQRVVGQLRTLAVH